MTSAWQRQSADDGDRTGGSPGRHALPALGLGLLVAVSYLPALQGDFVWDDVIFSEEPVIHQWSGLWNIWFSPADIRNEGHYWPVVYTSFWLEHKLWGLAPIGYHVVNLLLHWLNTLLVWRLLRCLAVPGAWAAAAVFAVHPLHVESVAWLIERKDLLSGLFYLAAALTWIRFVDTPTWSRYGLSLALYVAALLSKSMAVTLPAALLIWHWWQRDRISAADLARLAPFFAVGLALTVADYVFYSGREPLALGYSFIERILIAGRALWFYAGKLVWPTDLAVIYPLWDVRAGDALAWAHVVAAAAVAAFLWLGRHRLGRGPVAAVLFYAVTLAPVLGFIDYGYMQFSFVADRFQYLAGMGLMALLVGTAVRAAGGLPRVLGMAARGAFALILAVLATLSWAQSGIYRDEVTFFSHIVGLNPAARDAYLNLGSALFEADRPEEGLAASRLALRHRPDSASAHSNVGRGLLKEGRFDEAETHLRRAVELDPRKGSARQNLAELLRKTKRYEEAVATSRAALRIDRNSALAYGGMGTALFELKRHEEAVAATTRALALKPDTAMAGSLHLFTGKSLRALGRLDEAEAYIRRATEIDARNPLPLVELAGLYRTRGRGAEADRLLERARTLPSSDAAALHVTAEALRARKRFESAMEMYRAAIGIAPEFAPAHAGLGIALLQVKRNAEAIEAMARALRLDPALPVAGTLHVLLGRAQQALGKTEAAAEHHERALDHDPRQQEALDRLAMIRFQQRRYADALELYRRLAEAVPTGAQTHANIGATLYHLGRPGEALTSFERALSLKPDLEGARKGAAHMRRVVEQRAQPQP
ncbi:MAG: tetratricopeptide repeat protein [Deltaproteobacteria bacterium]|nr:tetratricopeptide repeat protein [Deltaproteobacteria bacterium]